MQQTTPDMLRESVAYIQSQTNLVPEIALVLGSGLGSLAQELEDTVVIPYANIPHYLQSTVESHAGQLILGKLAGRCVVCMSGRFHYYEGYAFEQLAAPIRVLHMLGAKQLILTNAAGAVNTDYHVGDIMVVEDHIKLMGSSPMRGSNDSTFGDRFFDASEVYTLALRRLALDCAARLGQQERTRQGVYFFMPGPQFETPAEVRAIRILGGDAVGMSTVPEALTAVHCGMQILGLSLMTNMAAGVLPQKLSGDEVVAAANEAAVRFKALLRAILKEM